MKRMFFLHLKTNRTLIGSSFLRSRRSASNAPCDMSATDDDRGIRPCLYRLNDPAQAVVGRRSTDRFGTATEPFRYSPGPTPDLE